MATYEECLNRLAPEVREAVESVVEEAGTSDADWSVLQAAGKLLSEAKLHISRLEARLVANGGILPGNDECLP